MTTPSRDRHHRAVRRATPTPTSSGRVARWTSVLCLALAAWACNRPDAIEHTADVGEAVQQDGAATSTRHVFDPATVRTLHGTVIAVQPFQRMQGTRYGVRVRLDVDGERAHVYLGPQGFLASRGLALEPGDEIDVTGSVLGEVGQRIVIATEVIEGGHTYALRDTNGHPLWRGWRGGKDHG